MADPLRPDAPVPPGRDDDSPGDAHLLSPAAGEDELRRALGRCLNELALLHARVCPRQVLGLRIGLLGARLLGVAVPQRDKRLLALVETDGCLLDGISVVTGCRPGRRTLRVVDFGKVAATFVDTRTERAVRVWPHSASRARALSYAPEAPSRWHAQLKGYQVMPDAALLQWEPVELRVSVRELVSRPGVRAVCTRCGEEILNEREIVAAGQVVCLACAGEAYYAPVRRPAADLGLGGRTNRPRA